MTPFTRLQSIAAPMPDADIDTDIIFPARFLLLTQKAGLGAYAFHEKRCASADFVLDRKPWKGAAIIVAGPNFGCGSSREQAPWALHDLGIRCIIAPGFGEIFAANCLNNGMLPITLAPADHARAMAAARAAQALTVDLVDRVVMLPGEAAIPFDIEDRARLALLSGRDEIDRILLEEMPQILAFEQRQRLQQPWLFGEAPVAAS